MMIFWFLRGLSVFPLILGCNPTGCHLLPFSTPADDARENLQINRSGGNRGKTETSGFMAVHVLAYVASIRFLDLNQVL
jgi:hypothetical protein